MFQKSLEDFYEAGKKPETKETSGEIREMTAEERGLVYVAKKLGGKITLDEIKDLLVKLKSKEPLNPKEVGRMFLPEKSYLRDYSVGKYIIQIIMKGIPAPWEIDGAISGWEDNTDPNVDLITLNYETLIRQVFLRSTAILLL